MILIALLIVAFLTIGLRRDAAGRGGHGLVVVFSALVLLVMFLTFGSG